MLWSEPIGDGHCKNDEPDSRILTFTLSITRCYILYRFSNIRRFIANVRWDAKHWYSGSFLFHAHLFNIFSYHWKIMKFCFSLFIFSNVLYPAWTQLMKDLHATDTLISCKHFNQRNMYHTLGVIVDSWIAF